MVRVRSNMEIELIAESAQIVADTLDMLTEKNLLLIMNI